jgi:peptidoglycan/xylan/chitin deacetylase (PgdA/CDA1 family)
VLVLAKDVIFLSGGCRLFTIFTNVVHRLRIKRYSSTAMTHTQIATAATLTTAVAAGGVLACAALTAQSQIFGRVLIAGRDANEIALTYDDGPNDIATEALLEVLAEFEVRASFFLIGSFVRQRPQIVRAIAGAGHLVGNHTMTHPWLAWQSAARIREELAGCNAALEDALGKPVHYFRAPHGARRPYVMRAARELGLTTVQWNIMPGDWKPIGADEITARMVRGVAENQRVRRGSNIVLHDGGDGGLGQPRMPTVEATRKLLEHYAGRPGTRFVAVDAWN